MKVEVKDKCSKSKFPLICKCNSGGLTVLFTDETSGFVLDIGKSDHSVGAYFSDFASCFDKKYWDIFDGEITLKND